MRVVALLCWYDERPAWLARLVASIAPMCDTMIALDGAYRLFPDGQPESPPEQLDALTVAATAHNVDLHAHAGETLWAGEPEKRSALFQLGLEHTEPRDWFLVIDGDEHISDLPDDTLERLEQSDTLVGHVSLWNYTDREAGHWRQEGEHRALVRALPELRVIGAHFIYCARARGRTVYLRGLVGHHDLEPAGDFRDIRIEHLSHDRDPKRHDDAWRFYRERDRTSAENMLALADP